MSVKMNPVRPTRESKPLTRWDRKWLRLKIAIKKRFSKKKVKPNENQELALKAVKKLLANEETLLLYTPTTCIRSMKLKDDGRDIYATIEENVIRIINGRYSYDVWVKDDDAAEIKELFDAKVERLHRKMEEVIFAKRSRSLKDICDELSHS